MAIPPSKLLLLRVLLIISAGLWVFSPAIRGDWIWDDGTYITQNHLIHDPFGFWKVWFNVDGMGDYYPLTSFVQWFEWQTAGNNMLWHHLVSIVLHLTSAFLIWTLFERIGLRHAWVGALIFTVHPVMVESVAWISELKNTLSLPPLLLAMLSWLDWKETGQRRCYSWTLNWYIISMLAKTSGLMLPFIFLGYAWWNHRKITWKDVKELGPFVIIAVLAAIATTFARGNPNGPGELPLNWRLDAGVANVGWSILFLLGKCLFPVHMLPIYSGLLVLQPTAFDLLPWLILGILFSLLWFTPTYWARVLLAGLGFFIINLVPVFGYTLLKYPVMVWSMDHLVYLPIIGLIGVAVAALDYVETWFSGPMQRASIVAAAVAVAVLAWQSYDYAGYFIGPEKLWTYTVEKNPGSWLAHDNLGDVQFEIGHIPEALVNYQKALEINPYTVEGHNNLGLVYFQLHRDDEAIKQYQQALKLNGRFALAHSNLGNALQREGRTAEAIEHYKAAIQIDPFNGDAFTNLDKLQAKPKTKE